MFKLKYSKVEQDPLNIKDFMAHKVAYLKVTEGEFEVFTQNFTTFNFFKFKSNDLKLARSLKIVMPFRKQLKL